MSDRAIGAGLKVGIGEDGVFSANADEATRP